MEEWLANKPWLTLAADFQQSAWLGIWIQLLAEQIGPSSFDITVSGTKEEIGWLDHDIPEWSSLSKELRSVALEGLSLMRSLGRVTPLEIP
jgi:hypothetical protein